MYTGCQTLKDHWEFLLLLLPRPYNSCGSHKRRELFCSPPCFQLRSENLFSWRQIFVNGPDQWEFDTQNFSRSTVDQIYCTYLQLLYLFLLRCREIKSRSRIGGDSCCVCGRHSNLACCLDCGWVCTCMYQCMRLIVHMLRHWMWWLCVAEIGQSGTV